MCKVQRNIRGNGIDAQAGATAPYKTIYGAVNTLKLSKLCRAQNKYKSFIKMILFAEMCAHAISTRLYAFALVIAWST